MCGFHTSLVEDAVSLDVNTVSLGVSLTFQWSVASHNPSTQLHIPEELNPHQIFAYSTFREVTSAE